MAHAANISQLTGDLVRSIVSNPNEHFDQLRDKATRTLRNASLSRTNQFDVQSRLSGLVEKFGVLNRESLGEALQTRLDQLPTESRWLPEVLSLLLALSDRPLEKTDLADVEALIKKPFDQAGGLTWHDIVADDPLDNADGLWDDVDRGDHSSGDDEVLGTEVDSDQTTSTLATSIAEDSAIALARLQVFTIDDDVLDEVKAFHEHLEDDTHHLPISGLSLIRETLLMLRGLPTNTYNVDVSGIHVTPRAHTRLATTATDTMRESMLCFGNIGSSLNNLRHWVRSQQEIAYVQSCQAAAQTLLSAHAGQVADLEQKYMSTKGVIIVSLISVQHEVESISRPILRLARIVNTAAKTSAGSPFALLDDLYDGVCTAELSSDADVQQTLLPVLLAGLTTYLRPIWNWIAYGKCNDNDDTSLVEEWDADCHPSAFWRERYTMRQFPNTRPLAPRFFESSAHATFALGKSRAFLSLLNGIQDEDSGGPMNSRPDFGGLEMISGQSDLLPSSQRLEQVLDTWLKMSTRDSTSGLRQALLYDHGLINTLQSLDSVFCSQDGTAFQDFAHTLFWSMDHDTGTWSNDFLLTELAQATIGAASANDALIVRIDRGPRHKTTSSSIRRLSAILLEMSFSWTQQNITHTRTPTTYSKAFTLLLQLYRAKFLLGEHFFDLRSLASDAARKFTPSSVALPLRMRLMTTLDILHAYITTTASTLNSSLIKDIAVAEGVDGMADVWSKHDKQLEMSLLLAEKLQPMREALTGFFELCEQYQELWKEVKRVARSGKDEDAHDAGDPAPHVRSRLAALQNEASQSLSFIIAGLRGIGRAGGHTVLESLAERLEWIVH